VRSESVRRSILSTGTGYTHTKHVSALFTDLLLSFYRCHLQNCGPWT